MARLIRSKGVGVYFVTQNPADVPEDILGQLGNRVQHALRAFTAKDRKELRQAAQNYRDNPRFSIEDAIREVGTGEAVTSFLEAKGVPGMAERTLVRPPSSHLGAIAADQRQAVIAASPLKGKYDTPLDRDSAFEKLQRRAEEAAQAAAQAAAPDATAAEDPARPAGGTFTAARRYGGGGSAHRIGSAPRTAATGAARSSRSDSVGEAFAKSFARQLGTRSGQALVRGILGSLFKSR